MNRRRFLRISGYGVLCATCCPAAAAASRVGPLLPMIRTRFGDNDPFYREDSGGIRLSPAQRDVFDTTLDRLKRVQSVVGHGNFNLIGYDEMLRIAHHYSEAGPFTPRELVFIERLFYQDAQVLGFRGEKVITELDVKIPRSAVRRVGGSGHYLFKGEPLKTFHRAQAAVGDKLILTSGVRGVVKQLYLFLNKIRRTGGDVSLAACSVAPPGYSYHGISDFDIGQAGLGWANFTAAFSHTEIHRRLFNEGLVEIRYPADNPFGVRYEPWHIKVTT